MYLKYKLTVKSVFISVCLIFMTFGQTALALDDGARAYWKTMENTNVVGFQYLQLNADTTSQMFDPGFGIYPDSETDFDFYLLTYARHIGLFGKSAVIMGGIYGGDINSEIGVPFDPESSIRVRETANGFGDPSVGLTVNLYGAENIKNFYDMLNYEPFVTVDVSGLLTIPIGEYENDRAVNIGQNRWWGRFALPVTCYFGTYAPLYRTSLEITPSVFVFAKNDDFMGQEMKNDPLYQLEAHLTHDFTRTFFGSIDFTWRKGFDSELDGDNVGDELDFKALGFTLDFTLNDNSGIRFSYHSNFIDDDDLDADMMRIMYYYGWNELLEDVKVLSHH